MTGTDPDGCPLCEEGAELLTMLEVKDRYARAVLKRCGGNKAQTCRVLDIAASTLDDWMRRWKQAKETRP